MPAFKIDVTDRPVLDALNRLAATGRNVDPVLRAIGEKLVVMSKQSFGNSRAPDGTPWAPNSQATLEALLAKGKGNFRKKDGKLSAKGAGRVMAKKPLIGETHALSGTVHYNVAAGVLEFGSPMEYAAMQQLGGSKAKFPNLWGDIPARAFLPITPDGQLMEPARVAVLDVFNEALTDAWRG